MPSRTHLRGGRARERLKKKLDPGKQLLAFLRRYARQRGAREKSLGLLPWPWIKGLFLGGSVGAEGGSSHSGEAWGIGGPAQPKKSDCAPPRKEGGTWANGEKPARRKDAEGKDCDIPITAFGSKRE